MNMRNTFCYSLGRAFISAALGLLAAVMAMAAAGTAKAQGAYPTHPIKLVVGFAAGGPTDILARVIAKGMSEAVGEQIFIENRTGAGGTIATEAVARSVPGWLYAVDDGDAERREREPLQEFQDQVCRAFRFDRRHRRDQFGAAGPPLARGQERGGPDQARKIQAA
jgi:hypothetical protein